MHVATFSLSFSSSFPSSSSSSSCIFSPVARSMQRFQALAELAPTWSPPSLPPPRRPRCPRKHALWRQVARPHQDLAPPALQGRHQSEAACSGSAASSLSVLASPGAFIWGAWLSDQLRLREWLHQSPPRQRSYGRCWIAATPSFSVTSLLVEMKTAGGGGGCSR